VGLSEQDLARLRRAIALAPKGRFSVEPNPLVGCVLEKEGRVVGEAWHAAYGGPHAEAAALALAGEEARGATAFVSLEPCADHPAKKTPSCARALVEAGIARVVYAAADPSPAQGGRGSALLEAAGLEVEGPALPDEAAPLLEASQAASARARPWVILKWAMSADGRISPAAGKGGRISGEKAQRHSHELRGRSEAVAVGVETVLTDDPHLNCRLAGGPPDGRPQPLRVIFDSALRTPRFSRLASSARESPVLALSARGDPAARRALEERGVEVHEVAGASGRVDLDAALAYLHRERGVRRLLVEGGARLHGAFLRAGLADQATVFVAPTILGARGAPAAVEDSGFTDLATAPRLEEATWRRLGEDLLLQGYLGVSGRWAVRS
jgi:diaminohydroxyphosphoribosylaminopyrimidine deaminase/5-amino-6-(5-phosphoribosylamino)uracil reductase